MFYSFKNSNGKNNLLDYEILYFKLLKALGGGISLG